MCTSIAFYGKKFLFGRNMDIEYSFGECVTLTPRSFRLRFAAEPPQPRHYAMLGIASKNPDFPLYAEAFNEKGLCAAGLNFPQSARYARVRAGGKHNVQAGEMIAFVLSQCESVSQAKTLLQNTCVIAEDGGLPPAPLHWAFADDSRCIVAEPTENGLCVYENPVGVLTNEPPFPVQFASLNSYVHLSAEFPKNSFAKNGLPLAAPGVGSGAVGLPGDAGSPSRFVRAAFYLQNSGADEGVPHFFHLLSSVEMPRGGVLTRGGVPDYTRYGCCIDAAAEKYYLKTYGSLSVQTFGMSEKEGDALQFSDIAAEKA